MSVERYTPEAAISMTPAAAEHARRQLERVGADAVRVGVRRSGCSGYMYTIDFVETSSEHDEAFEVAPGVTVYVSREALPLVQGTEIDFVTEGLNSVLRFNNPNAQSECGCGESFAV